MSDRAGRLSLLAILIGLAMALRSDLVGRPFIEYFANRQVQNAIPIRLLQEGRFTLATLPTQFTDTFGVAEFPLLPVVVSGAYQLLRWAGWVGLPVPGDAEAAWQYYLAIATLGRLWSLGMTALMMIVLYNLVRRGWSERAACWTLFYYAVLPYNRFFDQLFLAEPTIMACSIIGMYQLWRWSQTPSGSGWRLFAAGAAFALVLLLKVNQVMIVFPILYCFYRRFGWKLWRRGTVWLFSALVALPAVYFYLVRESWVTGGMDQLAWRNTLAIVTDWPQTARLASWFWQRHAWMVWTPLGTALLAIGAVAAWRGRSARANGATGLWMAAGLGWVYYWFMNGDGSGHLYYQAPSVPVAAVFMGIAVERLLARRHLIMQGAAVVAGAAFLLWFNGVLQYTPSQEPQNWRWTWDQPPMLAGLAADRLLPPDAKVVAGCNGALQYPMFYYLHRDGWFLSFNESRVDYEVAQEDAPVRLEEYREAGAQFYVAAFLNGRDQYGGSSFTRQQFEQLPLGPYLRRYPVVAEADAYLIVDLRQQLAQGAGASL